MAEQPGSGPTLFRCPQCMHPVAPGPGVPTDQLGPFTAGVGADCNECGTAFPPGTRLLVGGSGASDDPHRSVGYRWLVGVLVGVPTAIGAFGLGWLALALLGRANGIGGMVVGAALCLGGAIFCVTVLYRKVVLPLLVTARGGSVHNRSAWLVGGEHFDRFRPTITNAITREAAGPLLGVAARSWTRRPGSGAPEHFVTMHAVDGASLRKVATPGMLPRMLWNLLQREPAFLGPSGAGTNLGQPVMRPRNTTVIPAPTLTMRIAGDGPGSGDAARTVRSLARACIGEADAAGEARMAVSGATRPSSGVLASVLGEFGMLLATVLLVVAGAACLVFGAMKMVSDNPGLGFLIMFFGSIACIMVAAVLQSKARPFIGFKSTTRWEASDAGLLLVDATKDGRMALALGIPARTLATIAPTLARTDEGDGECTVKLVCGEVIIKQITLAQPPDAALDAVKRLLQAVPTPAD
jgi:hypothetical protein